MKLKLLVLAASMLMTVSMMAQKTSSTHSSGAFADVSAFTNNSNVFADVTRTDDSNGNNVFLFLDIFSFTNDGFTDTFFFGTLPPDALEGDNTKHLSVNVSADQVAALQITTCTFSFTTFTDTCQPATGAIQLDFQQNGAFSNRTISDTTSTFSQVSFRNHQDSDSASAVASGSVLGLTITNGFADVGTNRDTTLTFTSKN